jgi:hypothetical protein
MRVAWIAAFLMAIGSAQQDPADAVRVQIDEYPLRPALRPFGINLGSRTFWDAGQFTRNLVLRNPGFEGMMYRSVIKCAAIDASSGCAPDGGNSAWPDGFWQDGNYEIATGAALGATGRISAYKAGKPAGARVELLSAPRALAANDWVILSKEMPGDPAAGWWPSLTGGATVSAERIDLPPGTGSRQAVRISSLAPLAEVRLASMFDTMPGRNFVRLNGKYKLSFWAKGAGGSMLLHFNVARFLESSALFYLEQTQFLEPLWHRYEYTFTVNEGPDLTGPVRLLFRVDAAQILLDDVSLEQADGDVVNPTAFRDSMLRTLRELNPGILRYWSDQLGESLENQIAPAAARQRPGYSAWLSSRDEIIFGLHEFLELCEQTGADPWIVVPPVYSLAEASGLIEYLAGPASSDFGSKRAARGRETAWTDAFSRIHLEFGNESWNGIFRGGTIEDPKAYGERADAVFTAMRRSQYFQASKFDLIIGGQAVWVGRNREIQTACKSNDTLAIAPYMMPEVNSWADAEQLFAPLFAEAEWNSKTGPAAQNREMLDAIGRAVNLSVYEINLHTTGGSISQAALDQLTPSLGAGLAVASSMLQMLRDLDIRDQVLYSLPQYDFQRSDGKRVKLWGALIDMEVTSRKRPQFLALQMINRVMMGSTMIVTTHQGPDPIWAQPLVNGVQLERAHALQSFAFQRAAGGYALVLFNLSRTSDTAVTFTGAIPLGTVRVDRLNATEITATNEQSEAVTITTSNVAEFDAEKPFALPAHSLTVLTWGATGEAGDEYGTESNRRTSQELGCRKHSAIGQRVSHR